MRLSGPRERQEEEQGTGDGVKSVLDLAAEHTAKICEAARQEATKGVVGTGNFKKKVVSDSLGVHPSQISELRELNKKLGVEVEIDGRGRPVFDNSAHFRRYAKAHGYRHYQY